MVRLKNILSFTDKQFSKIEKKKRKQKNCETRHVLEYISHMNSNKPLHFTAYGYTNVLRQVFIQLFI